MIINASEAQKKKKMKIGPTTVVPNNLCHHILSTKALVTFQKNVGTIWEAVTMAEKQLRRNISNVVADKAITEDEVIKMVKENQSVSYHAKSSNNQN